TAEEVCRKASLDCTKDSASLSPDEQKRLIATLQATKIPPPPVSVCLSPIGEDLITRGIEKEFELDFIRARTRPGSVYSGQPFMVEAAIGYGGKLPPEGNATILRFANRVPLMYQQGACAITQSIAGMNWKTYGIAQSGLPTGPLLILVHIASTSVPFTSESKDAIASIPEIEKEIVLALQELGRDLKMYLSRRDRNRLQEDRARAVCAILPELAEKVAEIVEEAPPDISPIEGRIMRKLVARKRTREGFVSLEISNYTQNRVDVALYDLSGDEASEAVPPPDFMTRTDDEFTKVWKISLDPTHSWVARYPGKGGGAIELRGLDPRDIVVVNIDE
ncbi:MAG: DNA topoisomerase VI subunit B, partial [Methanoregulaceae archaeon]|nr:DNA topoisomerase VI subunit B [Methanoregulaceae archaeon]